MALPERKDMVVYKDTVDMEKEMEIKMSIHDALDTLNPCSGKLPYIQRDHF